MRAARTLTAGLAVALTMSAGALSACGSSSSGSSSGSSGGGGGGKQATVAAVLELTGPFAAFGQQAKAGIVAALRENPGAPVKVKFYDCGASKEVCVNDVRQAVTADGANAVVGPIVSLDLIPTQAITKQYGVPHAFVTVNRGLTANSNAFRFGDQEITHDAVQADYIAAHARAGDNVAVIYAANDFGQEANGNITSLLKAKGVTVAKSVAVQLGQADYTPAVLQVRSVKPKFVVLYTQPPADVAAILKGMRQNGVNATVIMDANPDVATVAGAAANGILQFGPWFPVAGDQRDATFIADAKAGAQIQTPSWVAAMTHDATLALIDVAKQKGTSRSALLDGLTNLQGFDGLAAQNASLGADRTYIKDSQIARLENGEYQKVAR